MFLKLKRTYALICGLIGYAMTYDGLRFKFSNHQKLLKLKIICQENVCKLRFTKVTIA